MGAKVTKSAKANHISSHHASDSAKLKPDSLRKNKEHANKVSPDELDARTRSRRKSQGALVVPTAGALVSPCESQPRAYAGEPNAASAFLRSIGNDSISDQPFFTLAQESFRNHLPYVFVAAHIKAEEDEDGLGDITLFSKEAHIRSLYGGRNIKYNYSDEPIEALRVWMMLPWEPVPRYMGDYEDFDIEKQHALTDLRHINTAANDSPVRASIYAAFSLGLGVEKDQRLADYVFQSVWPEQRQKAIDKALEFASATGPIELVRFYLEHGAHAARPYESDDFTALEIATMHGRLDVARLLLEFGADPRQSASRLHGRSLDRAREYPALLQLFHEHLKGKSHDVCLFPRDGAWHPDPITRLRSSAE